MNPLTQVKRIQKINSTEAALGISDEASWHAKYKDSAYVFVGGIPFDLSEGDLLAVFAQYGEIVDVNLVRDKGTGKSKGFAFLAYEDQRSTILAVDNLNGAKILGRIVRVDHVSNYKKKEEEDEEKEQQKREARGVCHAYQRGECNRGAACKFSHDEQRSANTGWGPKDSSPRWDHDRYDGPPKSHKSFSQNAIDHTLQHRVKEGELKSKSTDKGGRSSKFENDEYSNSQQKQSESSLKDQGRQASEKITERKRVETKTQEDRYVQTREKQLGRRKSERNQEDDLDRRGNDKRSRHDGETSSRYHRVEDKQCQRGEHK